ncbi:hypothetical protein [Pseudanabaena minima]|uniref:hypothetical protein n=1 Tax=Pseudanabaena minima TaxID=890415 RepID=UPI003DA8B543
MSLIIDTKLLLSPKFYLFEDAQNFLNILIMEILMDCLSESISPWLFIEILNQVQLTSVQQKVIAILEGK